MGSSRHIPTGWMCSELHPPCTASHLGCPGLSFAPSQPSAPRHFSIRELSFGEFSWDQAAGTGGTGLSLGRRGLDGNGAHSAGLELCSKWRPWNICTKNKQIHTKYIPTTRVGVRRKSRNLYHGKRIERTNKNYSGKETFLQLQITHHCCASAWKVRIFLKELNSYFSTRKDQSHQFHLYL